MCHIFLLVMAEGACSLLSNSYFFAKNYWSLAVYLKIWNWNQLRWSSMCTQQTIDKLFSSQHLNLQYLSATSLEMTAAVLLGQKLISCKPFSMIFGSLENYSWDFRTSTATLEFVAAKIGQRRLFQKKVVVWPWVVIYFKGWQGRGSYESHPWSLLLVLYLWKANLCGVLVHCLTLLVNFAKEVKIGNDL